MGESHILTRVGGFRLDEDVPCGDIIRRGGGDGGEDFGFRGGEEARGEGADVAGEDEVGVEGVGGVEAGEEEGCGVVGYAGVEGAEGEYCCWEWGVGRGVGEEGEAHAVVVVDC